MKNTLRAIVFACMICSIAQNARSEEIKADIHAKPRPLVEVKAGYFSFTDGSMRQVYDQGGLDLQLSGSYPLYKIFQVYASAEWLEKSGRSLNGYQGTSIRETPLSLGLKTVFPITTRVEYYFTLGPRYFFVSAHNNSAYVPHDMNADGLGGFANTGFLYNIGKHFTIDLFGEYSYARLAFQSNQAETQAYKVQVGGLVLGAGLGYSF